MIYTKTFRLSDFEWTGNSKRVVEMICNAGKSSEFVDLIEERFDHESDTAADFEINKWVIDEVVSIMGRLGLTLDGKPVKKKFKVFYRITGVSNEEVEADNAEDAREKFLEEFYDGDPLHCIDRDDIESVVPLAYEEGDDGGTVDYGPSDEARKELDNALVGVRIFALVRVDKDECGTVDTPSVRLFASLEEAKQEMLKDYAFAFGVYDRSGNVDSFMPVEDGVVTCYVHGKDGTEAKWNIIEVLKGIERSKCVPS